MNKNLNWNIFTENQTTCSWKTHRWEDIFLTKKQYVCCCRNDWNNLKK